MKKSLRKYRLPPTFHLHLDPFFSWNRSRSQGAAHILDHGASPEASTICLSQKGIRAVVLCCLPSGVLQPRHTAPPLRCGRHHGSAVRQKDGTTPMEAPRKFYSSMLLRSNTLSVLERYSRRLNGNVDSIGYGVTLIDKLPLRRISHDNSSRPNFHPRSS